MDGDWPTSGGADPNSRWVKIGTALLTLAAVALTIYGCTQWD